MKIVEIEQNTPEWLEFKRGKSGGSGLSGLYSSKAITKELAKNYLEEKGVEIPYQVDAKGKVKEPTAAEVLDLLTAEDMGNIRAEGNKKDGYYKLVAEMIALPILPENYEEQLGGKKFSMMERGHILEPLAVQEFTKRTGKKASGKSIIWQRDDNPDSILSPDETVGETEAIEVKCLDSHRMIRAFDENQYPEEYHEQIVKYFIVNEKLKVLHFVMFTDVIPSMSYLQFDIKRENIEDDIRELKSFEDSILKQAKLLAEKISF